MGELRRASAVECDDRLAHGHRFQEGHRARLFEGGHREHVGGREELCDVRAKAREDDVTFQAELFGHDFELRPLAFPRPESPSIVLAYDQQLEVFVGGSHLDERLQEIGVSLPGNRREMIAKSTVSGATPSSLRIERGIDVGFQRLPIEGIQHVVRLLGRFTFFTADCATKSETAMSPSSCFMAQRTKGWH